MVFAVACFLSAIVVTVSYRLRLLTKSGAGAGFVLGAIYFGFGGVAFSLPVIMFFVSSSLLAKVPVARSAAATGSGWPQSGARDALQVLANGLLPAALLVLWVTTAWQQAAVLYVVALAAATADTWATETGKRSRSQPRLITTLKPVTAGVSGGVTGLGFFAAACGAASLSALGLLVLQHSAVLTFSWQLLIYVSGVAFVAQIIDSILGATMQVKYYCEGCNTSLDAPCSAHPRRSREAAGFAWCDNNLVNFLSVSGGICIAWLGLPALAR